MASHGATCRSSTHSNGPTSESWTLAPMARDRLLIATIPSSSPPAFVCFTLTPFRSIGD